MEIKPKADVIYLDHAATTYLDQRVAAAMTPYWEEAFGNPSSLYKAGQRAKRAVNEARLSISRVLHCEPSEIIFTGSGTESDNLAILGVCKAWEQDELARVSTENRSTHLGRKRHIITSAIEHHAVLAPCQYLEKQGYVVTYLPVTADGLIEPALVAAAIRPDTLLVSIMYANSEIGTIQPIEAIAKICRAKGVIFHTDACQAAGALSLDVRKLGVDLLSFNGSKIYGPKGIGVLYLKQGVAIEPLVYGGGQEKGVRSGTENVPAIVGLARALSLIDANKANENKRLIGLRDYFIKEVTARIEGISLNGHPTKRLPNNVNLSIDGIDGESLILLLDDAGIAAATGSACDSASLDPSHVIMALGNSKEVATSSVRFSFGLRTSKTDLEYTVRELAKAVDRLRQAA